MFIICKNCQGTSCLNQQPICDDEDDDNVELNEDGQTTTGIDEDLEENTCNRRKTLLLN